MILSLVVFRFCRIRILLRLQNKIVLRRLNLAPNKLPQKRDVNGQINFTSKLKISKHSTATSRAEFCDVSTREKKVKIRLLFWYDWSENKCILTTAFDYVKCLYYCPLNIQYATTVSATRNWTSNVRENEWPNVICMWPMCCLYTYTSMVDAMPFVCGPMRSVHFGLRLFLLLSRWLISAIMHAKWWIYTKMLIQLNIDANRFRIADAIPTTQSKSIAVKLTSFCTEIQLRCKRSAYNAPTCQILVTSHSCTLHVPLSMYLCVGNVRQYVASG